MQNRLALKQLLIETCLQEKHYLDVNKRTAENEVMRAQKLVSVCMCECVCECVWYYSEYMVFFIHCVCVV